jgi:prevent-host-death family protein
MTTVTIQAAKTHLSKLIEKACQGEQIVIARGTEPMVKLVPLRQRSPERRFGALKGRISLDASFFEPLAENALHAWER